MSNVLPVTLIERYIADNSIAVDDRLLHHLEIYTERLLLWNEKINLTAITETSEIAVKHFVDSLTILKHVDLAQGAKVVDVGTGAGFPGMVLKMARPDLKVTLLDGHAKRFLFLEELMNAVGLSVELKHGRAEEVAKKPEFREQFDLVTARAVAKLNTLSEYCLPFATVGGTFVAMKGPTAEEERKDAERAINLLGGVLGDSVSEALPDGSDRFLILVKKTSQTPPKYPRISAKISKQPL